MKRLLIFFIHLVDLTQVELAYDRVFVQLQCLVLELDGAIKKSLEVTTLFLGFFCLELE